MLNTINKLVINLPNRPERLKEFKTELNIINCDVRVVEGIMNPKPMLGIAQAHLNCINIAKQGEWDKVLIMEDDCVFQGKEKTLPYLNECFNNLPNDWDILLGGIYHGKIQPFNSYWDKVGEFCALHFYIVNSKAYDKILEYDFQHHIDRWINLKGTRLNCYVTKKFIATQRNGFSDNVRMKVDYKNRLNKYSVL